MELAIRGKKLRYKKYVLSYVKYDMAVNSYQLCHIYIVQHQWYWSANYQVATSSHNRPRI